MVCIIEALHTASEEWLPHGYLMQPRISVLARLVGDCTRRCGVLRIALFIQPIFPPRHVFLNQCSPLCLCKHFPRESTASRKWELAEGETLNQLESISLPLSRENSRLITVLLDYRQ
jgi:hypothetical protein